ncbi:hemolysin family protein [Agromyces archimandritae]|uniref:HlyC/CorC family transporter n=1 Tax=Agromyces archimandritae TaxID=2781962 RepID=A0A975INS2_9MICO|nr:hemolysin family protein [Agromyces archimandritae]QTX04865.1 HlyC/CorC family transporter [Agromyces archimandritae]
MLAWWFFGVAFVLVAFGGLMAAVDSAIGQASRADLVELAERSRAKRSLRMIAEDAGAHVNAVNFVRIVVETTAAVLVTIAFSSLIENVWLVLLASALIMTAVSFVLVGASPRSVGRAHAATVLRLSAPVVHFLRVIIGPLANALVALGNRVTPGRIRFAGVSSEAQLLSMVDEATELEVLEEDDRELIHSIFEFNETVVREVMVPRTDMITIDRTEGLVPAMALFLKEGFSRIPVIDDGDADEIAGILYLRDLAKLGFERPLAAETITVGDLVREAVFVPESMKADALLRQMQQQSNHLAMVVDEYGGIAGLVTLEDLIEELVGDISDEYDREAPEIEALGDGRYRVSARLAIDELGELFGIELDDEDVDSVGGLVAKELGRLPQSGDRVPASGLVLEAERTEGRRKRLSTVIAWRDQALIDVQRAFAAETPDDPEDRPARREERRHA